MNQDSILDIENDEVASIYRDISLVPNLASYIDQNGNTYYFDDYKSLKEYLEDKKIKSTPIIGLNGIRIKKTVTLWDYINMEGPSITRTSSDAIINIEYPGDLILTPLPQYTNDINDRISSFRITREDWVRPSYILQSVNIYLVTCITLFEDPNYGGRSITMLSSSKSFEHSDLRHVILTAGGLFHKKRTWNDRVSSIAVWCQTVID